MNKQSLIITKFENILYSSDKKGHVITMQSRYASCFIITLKGKIHFSFNGFCITTDSKQAIFIPKGCAYKNECLEDAESIVVNFEASQAPFAPCPLQPLDATTALRFYNNINRCVLESGTASQFYLLSELYLMAHQLFRQNTQKSNKDITAENAIFPNTLRTYKKNRQPNSFLLAIPLCGIKNPFRKFYVQRKGKMLYSS